MKYRIWDKIKKKYDDVLSVNQSGKVCSVIAIGTDYTDRPSTLEVRLSELISQDTYTVELSTGLFDCKGNEIYEGDIVRGKYYDGFVTWHMYDVCWVVMETIDNEQTPNIFSATDTINWEVIGTIHDKE